MNRLVAVHGFTQTRRSWERFAPLWGDDLDVISVDAPGHGSASDVEADLWHAADHVAAAGGHATYLGYSMGARIVLHLALTHPDLTERIVLVSGTAGIDDDDERARRRRDDERRAAEIERGGVAAFLDTWQAMPMFAALPDDPDDRADRRRNTAAGLASSLRLAGTGTQDPPLWDRLGEIDVPTLVLSGALDAKFTALGRRLAAGIGDNATFDTIGGAGHAAHLERPERFAQLVTDWISATPTRGRTAAH